MKILPLQWRVVRNARRRGLTVYSRRQWGSKQKNVYAWRLAHKPVTRKEADTLWQHISVTRDDGTSKVNFFADMQELERIGMDRFGSGVSYNFAIDMTTAEIGVGQPLLAKGTHTVNNKDIPGYSFDQNAVARAIVFIGMPGQIPNQKSLDAASGLMAAMIDESALTPDPDYNPHAMVAPKSCPTPPIIAQMPAIKRNAFSASKRRARIRAAKR